MVWVRGLLIFVIMISSLVNPGGDGMIHYNSFSPVQTSNRYTKYKPIFTSNWQSFLRGTGAILFMGNSFI